MRKPTTAQTQVLAVIAAGGGVAVHASVLNPVQLRQRTSTMVALDKAGWITVDRGTPDNRGGNEYEYRYSLTEGGWLAAGYDEATTGVDVILRAWAAARRGAELTFTTHAGERTITVPTAKGVAGAQAAYRALVDTMTS